MPNIDTITDRLTLIMLDIRIWSGRKKLRPEDLNLGSGDIPPEDLVSLGSKRVFDPEPLKVFNRVKQNAERACLTVGTRFLGGYAVPNGEAASVAASLTALKAQFDTEASDFLRNYDRDLEQWIASLPAWEIPIRRAIETASVVGGKLHFGFQLIRVSPAEHAGTLAEEVHGLANGIFTEVAQMARELDASFEGKDKLHRRALGTFSRIREKLACLSFIDARIQPVVDSIDAWVDRLPNTGPITGGIFLEGMGLALLLSHPDRMARHGAGQLAIRLGRRPVATTATGVGTDPTADTEESDDRTGSDPDTVFPVSTSTRPIPAPEPPAVESFFF